MPGLVHDPNLAAGDRETHRAGAPVLVRVRQREESLAHAVTLQDAMARQLFEPMEIVGGKRGAAGSEEPAASERRSRLRSPGKKLEELDVHRRDSLEESRALPLEGLRDTARVEALEEEQGHSVQKRAVKSQAEPVHVKEWESQRHPVLRRESPEARHRLRVGDQSPKRQLDPLAPSGGTRRVEEDRRVLVGWERRRLMARRGRRDEPIESDVLRESRGIISTDPDAKGERSRGRERF